jgi:GNAT superfamily N-acetyltransferase
MSVESSPLINIRSARIDEADALSTLVMRSKAHWGYDADFLERCRPFLAVSRAMIETGGVFVADDDGTALGVLALTRDSNRIEIKLLFIAPEAIGRGVGRVLWDAAVRQAHAGGHRDILVVSDPFAEGFYLRMGARRIGEHVSEVDATRKLPLLRHESVGAVESPSPPFRAERDLG